MQRTKLEAVRSLQGREASEGATVGRGGTTTCCCASCPVMGAVARTCWRSALTPGAMATATFLFVQPVSGGATIAWPMADVVARGGIGRYARPT
eukprot:2362764-Prymnesium_polylepis.1